MDLSGGLCSWRPCPSLRWPLSPLSCGSKGWRGVPTFFAPCLAAAESFVRSERRLRVLVAPQRPLARNATPSGDGWARHRLGSQLPGAGLLALVRQSRLICRARHRHPSSGGVVQ
jgi:hypothetical protein